MSTYYTYFLQAPLKDISFPSVQAFRDYAFENGEICFDIESGPLSNVSSIPSFGPSTKYEGPTFYFDGIDVSDGKLRIGVFVSNIMYPENHYEEDGIQGPQDRLRLENLLAFLSEITSGQPGEVQGTFGSQGTSYGHGNPIIRCADGHLRVLSTKPEPDDSYSHWRAFEDEVEPTIISGMVPADLVVEYQNDAFLKEDVDDKIIARLRPIDAATQKSLK
jgi:hypothetical protein